MEFLRYKDLERRYSTGNGQNKKNKQNLDPAAAASSALLITEKTKCGNL